jgi:ATP-dependent DNA helicase RecG
MAVTLADLERWLVSKETEHLEFKEAKQTFSFDDVKRYVVALGNEGGGHLVLGITPKLPRLVVGSLAFRDVGELKKRLYDVFRRAFDVEELEHPTGRVVVIHIPSRPVGTPLHVDGTYLVRAGESVVPMTADRLKAIFDEAVPDFSNEATKATLDDVSPTALKVLVELWVKKTGDEGKRSLDVGQVLDDLGLLDGGQLRVAGLVLLGTKAALRRHLAAAEVIHEYRAAENNIEYQHRHEWRAGFLDVMDEIWNAVAARNDVMHFQEDLFMRDVPVLREDVVREALLNAVSHRDYRSPGSIFLKQWPLGLTVMSPGGLPPGITVDNIVVQQMPRNRLIADTLRTIGLVERSGQGMDKMVRRSITDGKQPPDFTFTDAHNVVVTLHGEVKDSRFIRFLETIGAETLKRFHPLDFIVLDHVHRDAAIPELCRPRVTVLLDAGVIERAGKEVILSKALYAFLGERGTYTRRKGLDDPTLKALIRDHLRDVSQQEGASLEELLTVLKAASPTRSRVQRLLREMRAAGEVWLRGKTRGGRWMPGREQS